MTQKVRTSQSAGAIHRHPSPIAVPSTATTPASPSSTRSGTPSPIASASPARKLNSNGDVPPTVTEGSILIGRNKHFPYIASYHGPWLSLPLELFNSLLVINQAASVPLSSSSSPVGPMARLTTSTRRPTNATGQPPAPISPRNANFSTAVSGAMELGSATSISGTVVNAAGSSALSSQPLPPPIDPVVFKSLVAVRRLVEDAGDLILRAADGGTGGTRASGSGSAGAGPGPRRGRGSAKPGALLSQARQHRLREMAISKLAHAYRIDEIATSVLVMQSASSLDDVAAKVLRKFPNNYDAQYVHFFHEKIPSRMLACYTTTDVLDRLVDAFPTTAAYYRTRAMVHCFQENYPLALKDFKAAITMAKRRRRPQSALVLPAKHHVVNGDDGNEVGEGVDLDERQLFFLRGACLHQYAVSIIDKAIQEFNIRDRGGIGIPCKQTFAETPEIREAVTQCPGSSYRRTRIMTAPLEDHVAALEPYREQINGLLRRSTRDYAFFLSHYASGTEQFQHTSPSVGDEKKRSSETHDFASLQVLASIHAPKVASPTESGTGSGWYHAPPPTRGDSLSAFVASIPAGSLLEDESEDYYLDALAAADAVSAKTGSPPHSLPPPFFLGKPWHHVDLSTPAAVDALYPPGSECTYHPLLVEAWYAIGLNYLMLGDWETLARWHDRMAKMHLLAEGYPVFLPPRSMSQADYIEVLRLVGASLGVFAGRTELIKAKKAESGPNGTKPKSLFPLHTKRADILFVWLRKEFEVATTIKK